MIVHSRHHYLTLCTYMYNPEQIVENHPNVCTVHSLLSSIFVVGLLLHTKYMFFRQDVQGCPPLLPGGCRLCPAQGAQVRYII